MLKSSFCFQASKCLLVVYVLVVCRIDRTEGNVDSGCPSYGCLPSGTFALSSDIPGASSNQRAVGIKWTSQVAINTGGVNPLGCVTSQGGVVCATYSGFVSVDQLKGSLVWRYGNMTSPSLPIMDIYGEIIGTDGRHLVKIGADGKVYNPIKIYAHLNPMYSLQQTNDNLFLMASKVNGEIVTYGTDGIVEASYVLHDSVENVNGSFVPVAQPVIYGMRTYILTRFVPDSPQPQSHLVSGLQRLYAVDLWSRMVKRIEVAWYHDFEQETCGPSGGPLGHVSPGIASPGSSVLVHNHTVYVSLAAPAVGCGHGQRLSGQNGTLWAIRDKGTEPEVVFKIPSPVSGLSIHDVSLGQQRQPSWNKGGFGFSRQRHHKESPKKSPTNPPILWSATAHQITGYDSRNGSALCVFNVSRMLNVTSRITSKVMVARSKNGAQERLVFAVNSTKAGGNHSTPYVAAVSFDITSHRLHVLWTVAGKPGMEIVGQIPNVLVVPPEGKREKKLRFRVVGDSNGNDDDGDDDDDDDDVWGGDDAEVFLVATAVNETAQYSFAIGPA